MLGPSPRRLSLRRIRPDAAPAVPVGISLLGSCLPLLIPVAWGALGACTALAKRVSDRLTAMSYEENRMQGLPARIFLGAALALVLDILVFVERSPSTEEVAGLGFGPIVGAFLAGLFVQHIYGAFESLMRRVSRAVSPESSAPTRTPTCCSSAPRAVIYARGFAIEPHA